MMKKLLISLLFCLVGTVAYADEFDDAVMRVESVKGRFGRWQYLMMVSQNGVAKYFFIDTETVVPQQSAWVKVAYDKEVTESLGSRRRTFDEVKIQFSIICQTRQYGIKDLIANHSRYGLVYSLHHAPYQIQYTPISPESMVEKVYLSVCN
ncbi:hypothetical protein [Eikenella corrodens]|jgi:hypothetical protein|uniref:Uncharacterized protein n=1 Tax=Eikenella corrodens TaxID=539 RepID=A0A3S9SGF2_EIKCO|nr:hypothetical protein [Eikenella corrodens]AZR58576.1 hypothetical protein ELB75_00055 [Eikenella corrodens]DAJ73860.1 MAG TPA: Surface-adhesin protein E [Caudoviricetes sp.]DAR66805.1 MAG TPA: Surface-adhesin protein E [Caudoviricetes sp.]